MTVMFLCVKKVCYTGVMKISGAGNKVPITPKKVQLIFASVTGLVLLALLAFVVLEPVIAKHSDDKADQSAQTEVEQEAVEDPKEQPAVTEDETDKAKDESSAEESPAQEQAEEQTEAVETSKSESKPERENKQPETKSTAVDYTFVARSGDSYALMARASIELYAETNHLELSPAQRVAAETFLIEKSGSPMLEIGQVITISAEDVKSAVDMAQSLSDDELAAWDYFADQIDFENDNPPDPATDDGAGDSDVISGNSSTDNSATDAGSSVVDSGGV